MNSSHFNGINNNVELAKNTAKKGNFWYKDIKICAVASTSFININHQKQIERKKDVKPPIIIVSM